MFGPRRSTNFLMAKKTPLALSWKSFSQRSYLCETFGWVNTQIKPEVATSCFVPDTCGVAWGVRLTADSRAAWSGISAFRDISISSQEQAYWKETGQACIWRPSFSNWTSWIHTLTTQVSISYGFRFSTALILQRSETERIYMKRASTSKLIWIQTQFCSQNKKAKDLPKISETSTVMKSVNSTVFWLLRKETCEGIYCIINPRGNFSFLSQRWGRRRKICCFFKLRLGPSIKICKSRVLSMQVGSSTRTSWSFISRRHLYLTGLGDERKLKQIVHWLPRIAIGT